MRLKSPGEKIWTWLVNNANMTLTQKQGHRTVNSSDYFVTFEIRYSGIVRRTNKFEVRFLTPEMLDQILPSISAIRVRIYAILEKRNPTTRESFFSWHRLPWDYVINTEPWQQGSIYHANLIERVRARELQKNLLSDSDKRFALYKRDAYRARQTRFGFHAMGQNIPNPDVKTQNNIIAIEDTYTAYTVTGLSNYESYRRSYTSVSTPGFRNLPKKMLPVNPYTSSTVITKNGQGLEQKVDQSGGFTNVWNGTAQLWSAAAPSAAPTTVEAAVYNKAVRKLIEAAQTEMSANLAQDFAQIGQTVRLVVDTTSRITRSLKRLKKLDLVGAADELLAGKRNAEAIRKKMRLAKTKTLADNWLELQYGWKPLLQSIDGTMRATANYLASGSPVVREVSASAKKATRASIGIFDVMWGYRIGHRVTMTDQVCKLGIRFGVDSNLKAYLSQLGFTNPVNLAWEVLPFSFVVDWFLPVGPYLESLSAWDGCTFMDGYRTDYIHEHIFSEICVKDWPEPPTGLVFHSKYGYWTRETINMTRTKLTSLPSQRIPSLKNPISTTHALNGIALMVSTFTQLRRG